MPNFLIVEFGDNDFGHKIKSALIDLLGLVEHIHNYCPGAIKEYIIEYILFSERARGILEKYIPNLERIREYLVKMKVYWSIKFPILDYYNEVHIDHDGGSVCVNVHTKEVYTF